MKRFIKFTGAALLSALICAEPALAYQVPRKVQDDAKRYSRMAREMFASGRTTDGVKLLRMAIKTNPVDPLLRMDYVMVMSKKGAASLKDGRRLEAVAVFRSVEDELMTAAKLFKDAGANANAAQCLMQVSQIHRYVYENEGMARGYAQKALELDPNVPQPR